MRSALHSIFPCSLGIPGHKSVIVDKIIVKKEQLGRWVVFLGGPVTILEQGKGIVGHWGYGREGQCLQRGCCKSFNKNMRG